MRGTIATALVVVCALAVGACGSDDSDGGGGGAGSGGTTDGAKVIDVGAMDGAKGSITYCQGADSSGNVDSKIKEFEAANPGISVEFLPLSSSADEQRGQFVQRQEAKSGECDIFSADVIWTAEFASQKWLYEMTPYVESRKDELIPATLETATYEGKIWGMPDTTDAAFLYYRTDQVDELPTTWQEVYEVADAENGIVYQGAPYEGLTCDFLELAFAAGGEVLSEDGKTAVIDSPENLEALRFMVDGVKNGIAANGVTTYMEEEARRYFESGRATFMRNWPYAYSLGQMKGSKIKDKFDVMPFPPFEGAGKAGVLGGHNMVISVYSKNPGAALKFIDFATSEEHQTKQMATYSLASALSAVYDAPKIKKKFRFASDLRDAVSQAKPRPVSPVYPQISQAIYKNVNEALAGRTSPEDALKNAQKQMEAALKTF